MTSLGVRTGVTATRFGTINSSLTQPITTRPLGTSENDENAMLGKKTGTLRVEPAARTVLGALPRRTALGDRTNVAVPTRVPLGKVTVPAPVPSVAVPRATAAAPLPVRPASSASLSTAPTTLAPSATGTYRAPAVPVRRREGAPAIKAAIEPVLSPMVSALTGGRPVEDIDLDDMMDPQTCYEYAEDIMRTFRNKELQYVIDPNYMKNQADISPKMRSILFDWIIEVHLKFRLLQETLFLTTNIIDRFLSKYSIPRVKLQLVGIAAMLVASKYEEIYAPPVKDFLYVCDQAYTGKDVLDMERIILETLNFELLAPYPLHFLRRYSKAAKADLQVHTLAKYLIELTIPDMDSIKYLPSTIAAASLALALRMCGRTDAWDATLEHYSHYTEASLMPAIRHINQIHLRNDPSTKTVRKKYCKTKFLEVSRLPAIDI